MLILIADAHISEENGNIAEFFDMLELLTSTGCDVVFLGDIFDMWVGLDRYESQYHRRFIQWCTNSKTKQTIGFIEGNHEFFIAESYSDCFSWCSSGVEVGDACSSIFIHGDMINSADIGYLFFRKLTRNCVAKFLARFIPFGPVFVELLRKSLKKTNQKHRYFADDKLRSFADEKFATGVKRVFCGHFHCEHIYTSFDNNKAIVVPDWQDAGLVGVFDPSEDFFQTIHWCDIASLYEREA